MGARDVEKILRVTESMVKGADAQKEITMPMILRAAGYDVSPTTLRKHFKQYKVAFYKLKEKPLLQAGDVEERKRWVEAHKRRTPTQWVTKPHAIIDNKSFQMSACRKSREFVARRSIRGAYQKKGAAPKKWLVKPKCGANSAKYPGIQVTAGVIKGKIRMWSYVDGKWSAQAAAHMYKNVLTKALKRAFPLQRRPFTIIEDNDPTGYKSRAGNRSKADNNLVADSLPKRSPDLNVLDYSLWSEINRRMRAQERTFRKAGRRRRRSSKSASGRLPWDCRLLW